MQLEIDLFISNAHAAPLAMSFCVSGVTLLRRVADHVRTCHIHSNELVH